MTRETKVGLVVTCSFLSLVAVVLVKKLRDERPAHTDPNADVAEVPADPKPVKNDAEAGAVASLQGSKSGSASAPLLPAEPPPLATPPSVPVGGLQLTQHTGAATGSPPLIPAAPMPSAGGDPPILLPEPQKKDPPMLDRKAEPPFASLPAAGAAPAAGSPVIAGPSVEPPAALAPPPPSQPIKAKQDPPGATPLAPPMGEREPRPVPVTPPAGTDLALPDTSKPMPRAADALPKPKDDKITLPDPAAYFPMPPARAGEGTNPKPPDEPPSLAPRGDGSRQVEASTGAPAAPVPAIPDSARPAVTLDPPSLPPGVGSHGSTGSAAGTGGAPAAPSMPDPPMSGSGRPTGGVTTPSRPQTAQGSTATLSLPREPERPTPMIGGAPRGGVPSISMPALPTSSTPLRAASMPTVESYDEETYRVRAGDTFESISRVHYQSEKYAKALLFFNRSHPLAGDAFRQDQPVLQAGQPIYLPPTSILEKRYGNVIQGLSPLPADARTR
jgi:hypothetical protein